MKFKNSFFLLIIISILLLSCSSEDSKNTTQQPQFLEELDFIKIYGGSLNDVANSVEKTTDGGYIVLGYTQSMDGGITDKQNESFDYWLLKFDADDNLEWQRTYGGTNDDRGNDVIQTNDGGYAILGFSSSTDEDVTESNGNRDYWLVKLDNTGNITWEKSFGFFRKRYRDFTITNNRQRLFAYRCFRCYSIRRRWQ